MDNFEAKNEIYRKMFCFLPFIQVADLTSNKSYISLLTNLILFHMWPQSSFQLDLKYIDHWIFTLNLTLILMFILIHPYSSSLFLFLFILSHPYFYLIYIFTLIHSFPCSCILSSMYSPVIVSQILNAWIYGDVVLCRIEGLHPFHSAQNLGKTGGARKWRYDNP